LAISKTHHNNPGGAGCVYLDNSRDIARAFDMLRTTAGVEEIDLAKDAARLFHLHPERLGDIFLLAGKQRVFGDLSKTREQVKLRSHGSRHESELPLIFYNGKADIGEYKYNLDLTRKLVLSDS
jgi:phosphonoacetate hydrolase